MPYTTASPADFHQKSFRIKHHDHHDKFFTRLLSKESSKSLPSFRVYYGDVSSAVPFTWETRPGTPKHLSSCPHSDIPPLTPPPSYSYAATPKASSSGKQPGPKLLLHALLRKMSIPKKTNSVPSSLAPSSISSSSSCSSTLSWTSSSRSLSSSDPSMIPTTTFLSANRRRRFSSWGSYFDHDQRRVDAECCPNSKTTMCGKENGERNHHVSLSIIKKAFLSIIGRG